MNLRKKFGLVCLATLFLGAWFVSLAWACTGQSQIQLTPTLVPATRTISVTESPQGGGFAPGLVEIRWNSADGPVLGTARLAESERLSMQVAVPDVPPGVYYILAAKPGRVARIALEVVPEPGAASRKGSGVSSDLWSALNSNESFSLEPSPDRSSPGPSVTAWAGMALLSVGAVATSVATVSLVGRRRSKKVQGR